MPIYMMTPSPHQVHFNVADSGPVKPNYSLTPEPTQYDEAPHLPDYVTIYVTIINVVIFLVGVIGNVLVIVVVARVKDMRTSINLHLVNLSVADLLVLIVCQPTAIVEFYAKERWYLGAFVCKLVPVLEHSVLHASTLTILVISCERYHAICRPLKSFLLCSRPRPMIVMAVVWSLAVLTSLPFLAMTQLQDQIFYDNTPCQVCSTPVKHTWHHVYIISIFVIFFLLPMLLLSAMYGNIIRQMYHHRDLSSHVNGEPSESTGYNLRSRRQVIRMLIAIIVLFFVSLAPLRITIVWQIYSPPSHVSNLGIESYYNLLWIGRMLMYLNSAGNPIIYSLLSSNFKKAFTLLLQGRIHGMGSSAGYTGSVRHMSVSVALKRMSLPAVEANFTHHDTKRHSYDFHSVRYFNNRYSLPTI